MNSPTDLPQPSSKRSPALAILLVSLFGVMLSCYPVIFCGQSFASTTGVAMLYDWWPPLPQMKDVPQTTNHGSDTPALLIAEIPLGFIESRSLLEDKELPLWDRYGHAGYTLIGQAVTMLGDPLQLIVILGHGSALAWDIKFLCAKLIFCIGFGLLIFRLSGNRLLSILYAALASYCGAYFYINNHPAFFVFSYAPWLLLSALNFLDLRSGRYVRWGLVWLLVNFSCFNAGHVETAVVLIGGLNLAALVHALLAYRNRADALRILSRIGIGSLLFMGLTAPVWMSFLGTLGGSYSSHSEIQVFQLPFQFVLGAFDDLFYDLLRTSSSYAAPAPGSSLLIFTGFVMSLMRWRQLKGELFYWVNLAGIVLSGGCVFAMVPASILEHIPLFNRVGHLDTDFSYLLVIQLTLQSAYGFKCLLESNDFRRAAIDVLCAAAVLAGLLVILCYGNYQHLPVPWDYVFCAATGALGAPLLLAFLNTRQARISAAGWAGIIVLAFIPHFRFGLYNMGPDSWLMIPGTRAVLNAPSPAIDKIKARDPGPFRVAGMGVSLNGDYAGVYGLESIGSAMPLSNRELIELFQNCPGLQMGDGWVVVITDLAAAQPLLNLLNVKYLLGPPMAVTLPKGMDFQVVDHSDFGVLQNPEAWPRAFFSDKIISIASNEDFVKRLVQNGKTPFVALTPGQIETQPGLEHLESTQVASIFPATHYQLLPNSTAFDIHAPSAGIVCLSEGQAKDFFATANGQSKSVLTVNRAFKGIYLDQPGDYHIEFVYRPPHWRLSCALFWIALGILIMLACLRAIRRTHVWLDGVTGRA